jgi:hypothetical protein
MDSSDSLEQRVAAVESEVRPARRDSAAASILAVGADRDVADYRAEMRAHTRGLNALRQRQIEHHAEHKADSAEIRAALAASSAELKVGIAHIVHLLESADGGPGQRKA